jgi:hypothetical protein
MSMQPQQWSLSALAVELGIDRRTLAQRLQGVRPVTQKRVGQRIEKRWYLRDVLPYLDGSASSIDTHEDLKAEAKEMLKTWTYHDLIPVVIDSPYFVRILTGFLRQEIGLSKRQCVQVYRIAASALLWAISEGFEDQGLHAPEDSMLKEIAGLSPSQLDKWIDKHWPDSPKERSDSMDR